MQAAILDHANAPFRLADVDKAFAALIDGSANGKIAVDIS